MPLSFEIAKRYLFAKKSQNVINIISMISSLGIMVGTAALLIVMSVFNGLHNFVESLFGTFDPELKVVPLEGKVFDADSTYMASLVEIEGIEAISQVLEDEALLVYQKRQMPATIMGVDSLFEQTTEIDSIMFEGKYILNNTLDIFCVTGIMLAEQLGCRANAYDSYLSIYAPKRVGNINMAMPDKSFIQSNVAICGSFAVNQVEYDQKYAIIPLGEARRLFCYTGDEVSSLNIRLRAGADVEAVRAEIAERSADVKVLDRFEQHESFFKMMQVEKLMAALIIVFIIVIAAFNIIGSLSMLIYEKKESVAILKSMGADRKMVSQIFLIEGWMLSIGGALVGLVVGTILVVLQEQFGLIRFANADEYILSAYPVALEVQDVVLSFVAVVAVGILAAIYPVRTAVRKYW